MNEGGSGFFLVLEGVEGAGKTTQARWLAEALESAGVPCRVVREPGGTVAGERARDIVLDPALEMTPETELLLILAARAEFVREVVRPALEAGEVVIADRYEMSTLAYQGAGRGLGVDRVTRMNEFATGGLKPDAVLLLEVDPADGLARKSGERDRLERAGGEFLGRVAAAYGELAGTLPDVHRLDAGGSAADTRRRIFERLAERFPETFAGPLGLRN